MQTTGRQKTQDLEDRLRGFDEVRSMPAVWNSPGTDAGLKQRIVRILVEELVVDVEEEKQEVILLIHWAGGSLSELRVSSAARGNTDRRRAGK